MYFLIIFLLAIHGGYAGADKKLATLQKEWLDAAMRTQ